MAWIMASSARIGVSQPIIVMVGKSCCEYV